MLISLHWLADHLDLQDLPVEELSRLLTFAGVEVEGVRQQGVASPLIVVAQIRSFQKHPDADKLSVCEVDGGQAAPLQIVCGAKNFKEGDKVPLALEGAVLPGDFTIKKGKLRGVESQGMMCSGRELGLSADHEGLLILPPDAPVGTPLREYLGSDTLVEIEVTPNRPDLLSHEGLARELAALTGRARRSPEVKVASGQVAQGEEIALHAAEACPFYTARIIRGVKVGPSPDWLRRKLEAIGLRPINNVVDITNYVLHDLGQPLHAFDLAKLSGGLTVRYATEGEAFAALDGKTYALTPEDLVIADQQKALALAGVMGGEDSGVTEVTRDVLLESAYFQASGIRRTSRRLGLSSDSSYRFERGVDPEKVERASARAVELILELAGGVAEDTVKIAGTAPVLTGDVTLSGNHVRRLLGSSISDAEVADILTKLGLQANGEGETVSWKVPSYRADLQRPVDLIEEVARVAGLDGVPTRTQAHFALPSEEDAHYDALLQLKHVLAARGFCEARTIKLVSAAQKEEALGFDRRRLEPLALKNPLSDEHTHLRPSLIPGLLAVAEHNVRQGAEALRFFEAGTVFATSTKPGTGSAEFQALALVLSGPVAPSSWVETSPAVASFADLRGAVEALLPGGGLRCKAIEHPRLVLAVEFSVQGKVIGLGGQLAPARVRQFGGRHPVYVAELNLAALEKVTTQARRYVELPRFPAVTRDVALEMDESTAHAQIEECFAKHIKEALLHSVELFDVFSDPTGMKLPLGRKSLAYSLTYRDPARTLEAKEVDAVHARVVATLTAKLPVSVR